MANDLKVICWDLDETLGTFRRLEDEFRGNEAPEFEKPTALRYGLTDLLSSLSARGYEHYVATSARSELAGEVLKRTGISGHFNGVFGRETVSTGFGGKKYENIMEQVGFSYDQAAARMIVIGNSTGDMPSDLEVVFIDHRECVDTDSSVTGMMLQKLEDLGRGNFDRGFERMYKDAQIETRNFGTRRTYEIAEGVKVELEYTTRALENGAKIEIPIITNIEAGAYKRKTVPVSVETIKEGIKKE